MSHKAIFSYVHHVAKKNKRESITHNSFLDRLIESFVLAAVEVLEKINRSGFYIFVFLLFLNYLQRITNNYVETKIIIYSLLIIGCLVSYQDMGLCNVTPRSCAVLKQYFLTILLVFQALVLHMKHLFKCFCTHDKYRRAQVDVGQQGKVFMVSYNAKKRPLFPEPASVSYRCQ